MATSVWHPSSLDAASLGPTGAEPGIALAVVRGESILASACRGLANLETGMPINPDTHFHAASLAKQFTALAALQLREAGLLDFDEPIDSNLLHNYNECKITVRHLLTHTSGLKDQWPLMQLAGWRDGDVIDTQDVMRVVGRQSEIHFSPGSRFMYSNTGYTLLAQMIEEMTGTSFAEYASREIFTHLGMSDTFVAVDPSQVIERRADAYQLLSGPLGTHYRRNSPNLYVAGSTSLFTTLADYTQWIKAHRSGSPWSRFIDEMSQPQVTTRKDATYYGLGYFIQRTPTGRMLSHGGEDQGFTSYFAYFRHEQVGVVAFANSTNENVAAHALTSLDKIIPGVLAKSGRSSPRQCDVRYTGDHDPAMVYEGYYLSDLGEVRHVESRGTDIFVRWGKHAQILLPVCVDRYVTNSDEEYVFHRDNGGSIEAFHHSWALGSTLWRRIKPAQSKQTCLTEGCYFSEQTQAVLEVGRSGMDAWFIVLPKGWEPPDSVCTVLSPTESEIPIETLRQLLAGEDIEAYTLTVDQEEYGTDSEQRETHTQLPNNVPAQADVELAVRLGVGVVDVLEAAWAEFDMLTMTQERDRRVDELGDLSPGERTAHRGHITRLLSQRIQDRLKGRGLLIPEKEGVDDV